MKKAKEFRVGEIGAVFFDEARIFLKAGILREDDEVLFEIEFLQSVIFEIE